MNNIQAICVILASVIAVCIGLAKLTQSIFRVAVDLRDNKNATRANTAALVEFKQLVTGRVGAIEDWIREHDRRKN